MNEIVIVNLTNNKKSICLIKTKNIEHLIIVFKDMKKIERKPNLKRLK